MISEFYNLPFKAGEVIKKRELSRISLKESIAKMIHLIAITNYGEYRHDESFGSEIWEYDFVTMTDSLGFREQLKKTIKRAIINHEPRLTRVSVDVNLEQVEYQLQNRRTKMRISLTVSGNVKKTDEKFVHKEHFFIGPLSYY